MKELEFQCPECGAEVHPNARGCRNCGARRDGGTWRRSTALDGLDLPGEDDDDFDYDEFIAREFGDGPKRGLKGISGKKLFWWLAAVVTLIAFVFVYVIF